MIEKLVLKQIPGNFCVCRLPVDSKIPSWALEAPFFTISRTFEELSIVIEQSLVQNLDDLKQEKNWACLKVEGVLDFSLTGILDSIAHPLALNKISLFAVSTFDTDYILIKQDKPEASLTVLMNNNIEVTQ